MSNNYNKNARSKSRATQWNIKTIIIKSGANNIGTCGANPLAACDVHFWTTRRSISHHSWLARVNLVGLFTKIETKNQPFFVP